MVKLNISDKLYNLAEWLTKHRSDKCIRWTPVLGGTQVGLYKTACIRKEIERRPAVVFVK